MCLFLPERPRKMVSNVSIRPPRYLELLVPSLLRHWKENHIDSKRRFPNLLRSLAILLRKDNAVITLACDLLYVVYTCIKASLSVLLIDMYHLNQWQAGLVHLPFGLGGVASTFFTGGLMDKVYRQARTNGACQLTWYAGTTWRTSPSKRLGSMLNGRPCPSHVFRSWCLVGC